MGLVPRKLGQITSRLAQSTATGLVLLTASTWFIYGVFGNGFFSSFNLFTLSQQASETLLIGFAQLVVLAMGRLNLAVGAVGVSVVMATGWMIGVAHIHPAIAIPVGLLLGAAFGALMAWLELRTGLSSFVVTLAMQSIYTGAVLILSGGASVTTFPNSITAVGNASLGASWLSVLVIPPVLVALLLGLLYHRTTLGWRMLTCGANERAARLSAIRTSTVLLSGFAFSGLLSAAAGIMEMTRVSAALPSLGTSWLLSAFIVPVLGGTPLSGGRVSIVGALVAAIFLESISAGIVSLNVPPYWEQLVEALILLLAVTVDRLRRRGRPVTARNHEMKLASQ